MGPGMLFVLTSVLIDLFAIIIVIDSGTSIYYCMYSFYIVPSL